MRWCRWLSEMRERALLQTRWRRRQLAEASKMADCMRDAETEEQAREYFNAAMRCSEKEPPEELRLCWPWNWEESRDE